MKHITLAILAVLFSITAFAQQTFNTDFTQTKVMKLSGKTTNKVGHIVFDGKDQLRMIYSEPQGDYFIIEGNQVKINMDGKKADLDAEKVKMVKLQRATLLNCLSGNWEQAAIDNNAETTVTEDKGLKIISINAKGKVPKGGYIASRMAAWSRWCWKKPSASSTPTRSSKAIALQLKSAPRRDALFLSFRYRIGLIQDVVQSSPDVLTRQPIGFGIGMHAVRKEYEYRFILRVSPNESACKTRMTIAFHRARFGGRARTFLVDRQLVEADAATVVVGSSEMRFGEITYRLRFQILHAIVSAFIKKHLHQDRQIVRIGEQTRMACHTTKHGSGLVVDSRFPWEQSAHE